MTTLLFPAEAGGEMSAVALVEFFEALAACPREGAGAWVFEHGTSQLGVLLIENGRICWSTLPGRRKRLLEILQDVSGTPTSAIEDALRACITGKVSIIDGLVQHGVITREQLVVAVKRDTLESLLTIAHTPERRGIWRPHRGQGYGASIQFSLTELMVEAVANLLDAPYEALTASAAQTFGADAHFVFVSRDGLPVGASPTVAAMSVPECLALARRGEALGGDSASNIVAEAAPGDGRRVTVVWRDGPWRGVIETSGAPHLAVRKLMQREVVATS